MHRKLESICPPSCSCFRSAIKRGELFLTNPRPHSVLRVCIIEQSWWRKWGALGRNGLVKCQSKIGSVLLSNYGKVELSFSCVTICWVGVLTRGVGQLVMLRTFKFIGWTICWPWGSRLYPSRFVYLWFSLQSLRIFICKIRVVATSQSWCEERVRSHCEVASETAKCSVMVCDCHLAAHTISLNTVVLSTGYFSGGSSPGGLWTSRLHGHDQHPEKTERNLNLLTRLPAKWLM